MYRKLLILFLASTLLVAHSSAQELESATISSGGTTDLEGGGYKIRDIKGQPVAGEVTGGSIKVETGGIYTTITTTTPADPDITPFDTTTTSTTLPMNLNTSGPTIEVSGLFLEAYYDESTGKMNWPETYDGTNVAYPQPTVIAELWWLSPDNETYLHMGVSADIVLDEDGNGSNFGGWQSLVDGYPPPLFIVIKQKIRDAVGVTHMPLVSGARHDLWEDRGETALVPAESFSEAAASPALVSRLIESPLSITLNAQDGHIFNRGGGLDALVSKGDHLVVRNGDLDGNLSILATDFTSVWMKLYRNFNAAPIAADSSTLPYAIADCDGNGKITAADFTAFWMKRYREAKSVAAPHSVLPMPRR